EALKAAVDRLGKDDRERIADGGRRPRWYVNRQGQTFVVVDAHQPFLMGSPASEHGSDIFIEDRHSRRIARTDAIASCPVTIEQFRHFQAERPDVVPMPVGELASTGDCPAIGMTWYEAA